MDISFTFADFLDDMEIEYDVSPFDEGVIFEFEYDTKSYSIEVVGEQISINGEDPITYRELISTIF